MKKQVFALMTAGMLLWQQGGMLQAEALQPPPPKGDINLDFSVSIADLLLLQKWLLGQNEDIMLSWATWSAGDCNEDGKVNGADLSMLKQKLLCQTAPVIPTRPDADTLDFADEEALLAACSDYDLSQYRETAAPYYEAMFDTIKADGSVYCIAADDALTVTHHEHLTVVPAMAYEDVGLFHYVTYKDTDYLVMIYYAQRDVLQQTRDLRGYFEQRFGSWNAVKEEPVNGAMVSFAPYAEWLRAYAFFDENNYYMVRPQTAVTEEELTEFLQHLNFTVAASANQEMPHPKAHVLFRRDIGCTPRNPQQIAVRCYDAYAAGETVTVDLMMGDFYKWNEQYENDTPVYDTYGENGYPAYQVCEVDTLRYEEKADSMIRLQGKLGQYEKVFTQAEMASLDCTEKGQDFAGYHHEKVELDFGDCAAGSSGCVQFSFCWQYLDPPNPNMPREGTTVSLYYYVGEEGIVFSYSTDSAKQTYETYFRT